MCATNREHVSTLNERAFRPKDSGVDLEMLTNVTGPTQVFRIASGDMTPDDYAKGDAPIYQKGASTTGSTTTRFNKDHRYKAQWIEPIARSYELEPDESNICYWFPVFYDSVDFLCVNCRAAKSMDEIELSQHPGTIHLSEGLGVTHDQVIDGVNFLCGKRIKLMCNSFFLLTIWLRQGAKWSSDLTSVWSINFLVAGVQDTNTVRCSAHLGRGPLAVSFIDATHVYGLFNSVQ